MAVYQAFVFALRLFDGKIGPQIAVRFLSLRDKIHHTVRHLFQGLIRLLHKRIGDRFEPFIDITVLKHPSVVMALVNAGCDPEIFQRMAFLVRDGRIIPLPLDPDIDLVV